MTVFVITVSGLFTSTRLAEHEQLPSVLNIHHKVAVASAYAEPDRWYI